MQAAAFCVGGRIRAVYDVPVEKSRLMEFLANPKTFERYMPHVNAVRPHGESQDGRPLYEWEYEIPMPLAAPIKLRILTQYRKEGDTFYHSALRNGQPNMMDCSLAFEAIAPEQTFVTMDLTIELHRQSGAELHPLGALMGEAFMSAQMKSKMQSIATQFLQNAVGALARCEAAKNS
ncbi:MAG: hypothetical protein NZM06_03500 [Chloroherpetonaceae bacterium]|nr:hypothetical protein [Chloroherpetonaceae bacterium]MDW8437042.1 hypothetical protein [Chloroherpetonaceae bacterium]